MAKEFRETAGMKKILSEQTKRRKVKEGEGMSTTVTMIGDKGRKTYTGQAEAGSSNTSSTLEGSLSKKKHKALSALVAKFKPKK